MNATLFAGLALIASAPALKDPPGKTPSIEGDWTVESSLVGGKSDGVVEERSIDKIVITAGKWMVIRGGVDTNPSNLVLDSKQNPPHLDLTLPGRTGKATQGIYKLNGDTLVLCYVLGGDERPTKFESPPDSNVRIMTLKRLKK